MAIRKNIIKLAKIICGPTAMVVKLDENAPEYKFLDCLVSDDMAEVGLAMKLRKMQPIGDIAKRCGKAVEVTKRLALELADCGVAIYHSENGEDVYGLPPFVPGSMERALANDEVVRKHPQVAECFEEYTRIRTAVLAPMLPMGSGVMRTVPVFQSVDPGSKNVLWEDLTTLINSCNRFAVAPCSCRRTRRLMGEGCGHLEDDMCISLDKHAEYYIRTGKAREITREEAFAICKKAEENGLVHNLTNTDDEPSIICNCCACSCFSLRATIMFGAPDMLRSNFVAETDSEKCVACGQCVENCPMNALKLGQRLCAKKVIAEPKTLSPRDHIWGEKYWNPDYRTNKQLVAKSGTAPCKTACPAHIAVQGYIKLASQERFTEALELIKKENPFPAVCGRICPHECEDACTRGDVDQPIAIDEIKKFIADKELSEAERFIPKKRNDFSDKKIAIVGSGPAGLSCAYYLALDGYTVTVFEKQEKLGGMLMLGIPAFRLEKDVVSAEIDVLRQMGVEFKTGVEVGKDVTLDELKAEGYKGFYLAIGAQSGRRLGLEGEETPGVIAGVDFLRGINLGKPEKLSGNVVIIGGGNVAIDVARSAVREGGKQVSMFCLESAAEMPALPEEIEEATAEGITIFNGWGPKRIIVDDSKITGVEFVKCVSVFDENHRFSPKYDEKNTTVMAADYVLLSVGQAIEWGGLLNGTKVELGRGKTAVADNFTYQTSQPDVFVGGDVYTGPKFAIDAIAAGKQAAISLHRFVQPGQSLVYGRPKADYRAFDKNNVIIGGYDNTVRQRPLHIEENEKTFKDTRITFTLDQLKNETSRCLGCGAVVLDTEKCIGCGVCTTKCMFDAIRLKRVSKVKNNDFDGMEMAMTGNAVKRVVRIAATAIKGDK